MLNLLQLATGSSVREEVIEYIVANTPEAIEKGIKQAFEDSYEFHLGKFHSFELGKTDQFGNITLTISYVDCWGDIEQESWELRPVKAFL